MAEKHSTRAKWHRHNSPNGRDFAPIHGQRNTATYAAWKAMRQRCNDPNADNYPYYGGRGIKIAKRWDDFMCFLADLGPKPDDLQLDRADNSGDYKPGNVVWSDRKTQCNNTRSNRLITALGKTQTMSQWADEIGIKYTTLRGRIRRGWSAEQAITMTTENDPFKRKR